MTLIGKCSHGNFIGSWCLACDRENERIGTLESELATLRERCSTMERKAALIDAEFGIESDESIYETVTRINAAAVQLRDRAEKAERELAALREATNHDCDTAERHRADSLALGRSSDSVEIEHLRRERDEARVALNTAESDLDDAKQKIERLEECATALSDNVYYGMIEDEFGVWHFGFGVGDVCSPWVPTSEHGPDAELPFTRIEMQRWRFSENSGYVESEGGKLLVDEDEMGCAFDELREQRDEARAALAKVEAEAVQRWKDANGYADLLSAYSDAIARAEKAEAALENAALFGTRSTGDVYDRLREARARRLDQETADLLRGLVMKHVGGCNCPYAPWDRVLDDLDRCYPEET